MKTTVNIGFPSPRSCVYLGIASIENVGVGYNKARGVQRYIKIILKDMVALGALLISLPFLVLDILVCVS